MSKQDDSGMIGATEDSQWHWNGRDTREKAEVYKDVYFSIDPGLPDGVIRFEQHDGKMKYVRVATDPAPRRHRRRGLRKD